MDNHWDSVAAEAHRLVAGARGELYNHPAEDYASVVRIMDSICPTNLAGTPAGAIYQMIAVKFSRLRHGLESEFDLDRLRDHFVDACGYIDCLWATLDRERQLRATAIPTSSRPRKKPAIRG